MRLLVFSNSRTTDSRGAGKSAESFFPLMARRAACALILICACLFLMLPVVVRAESTFTRWSKVELSFTGPDSRGMESPNPFSIPFYVTFSSPSGSTFRVPGFYDGNGEGGMNGNVWRVRFSADRNGSWRYRTTSSASELNGRSGAFEVTDPPEGAPELFRLGRLEYTGHRYLKFRDGGYWIKAGADEPENFLGDAFGRNDWDAKKRQVDYLASAGINAVYVMTNNVDGDSKDVWPWPGATAAEAKRNHQRFDVSKLAQWAEFLEYVQAKGLVIQIVLEDDSAWTGFDRERYYREMVARFGYLPALYFNFCEEFNERYSLTEALEYMEMLAKIDPYNHPRAIHNIRQPDPVFVASPHARVASIQTNPSTPEELNRLAIDWLKSALVRNARLPVVSFDEARPADDRKSFWAAYMGGGIWESFVPVPNGYEALEPLWKELARARIFMESIPAAKMHPANHIVASGRAFCLANAAEVYGCYLLAGGAIELVLPAGTEYRGEWFDPRSGARQDWTDAGSFGGGRQRLQAPDTQDWALRIVRTRGESASPLSAVSAEVETVRDEPVSLRLAVWDLDSSVKGDVEIVRPPKHGTLSGEGFDRRYLPRAGFTGEDSFEWRVRSEDGISNTATIGIEVRAQQRNRPPHARHQKLQTTPGHPVSLILAYDDFDGPGPHRIRIVQQPGRGKLEGKENDVVYTPEPGFTGTDQFEWIVMDGAGARSNRASVEIEVQP
ncbi:MAG: DUF5060 domain-containing protein [Bryobacteraceae bacterium]